jgi:hypothetical protein
MAECTCCNTRGSWEFDGLPVGAREPPSPQLTSRESQSRGEKSPAIVLARTRSHLPGPKRQLQTDRALGARLSNASRAPSSRASRGMTCEFRGFFAGGAGLLGACSHFSDTLLEEHRKWKHHRDSEARSWKQSTRSPNGSSGPRSRGIAFSDRAYSNRCTTPRCASNLTTAA